MNNCIFCRIIRRELQANILHEDERVIAVAPPHPVSVGHTLVIPKNHHENLVDITGESLWASIGSSQRAQCIR